MITRRALLQSAVAAPALLPILPSLARAEGEDYPNGPVRSICMFPPGSGADVRVRYYAKRLEDVTKKAVVVENKPGAFGNIATEFVARARPDGYTLYIAPGSSTLAAAPALFKHLNYDPINDFEHITTLSKSAFVLCVDAKSPFKSVPDLTAYLKEKGPAASYGSIANPGLVASEIYKQAFTLPTVEVKYKENGPMYNDLFSGQIAFFCIDYNSASGQLQQGRLRALATTTAKPLRSVPSIPGAEEAGIPGLDVQTWWSVHVPAHTPKPNCDKLAAWFNVIAVDAETNAFNDRLGSDPMPGNPQSLKELLIKETKAWHEYVKLAHIEPA